MGDPADDVGGGTALCLGLTPFLVPLGPDDDIALLYLFCLLTAVVAVAGIGYSTIPRYVFLLDALALGPLTLRFAMTVDTFHMFMVISSVVWQVSYLRKAADVSQSAIDGILTNERLADEIERRERAQDSIRFMAHHDLLTGAGNRRFFNDMSDRSFARAGRSGARVGVVMIDLNDFKPVNDNYGHRAGDAVLKEVAKRLKKTVRESDFVARLGGDEFCLLVENVHGIDDLRSITGKVAAAIGTPIDYDGHSLRIGASFGCACYPDDGDELDDVLHEADRRMYEEKRNNKPNR